MASRRRVFNVTREIYVNLRTAEEAYDQCSADWLDYGKTMRDLTPAEAIDARNQQASRADHLKQLKLKLPYAEHFGLHFVPSESGIVATMQEGRLVRAAHDWMRSVAA